MQQLVKVLDYCWNIKFLKNYRSLLARTFLIGVSAYQALASLKSVHDLIPLPVIPLEIYSAAASYFGLKLEQFAKEHHSTS